MGMNRRQFGIALGGLAALGSGKATVLEAIVALRIPQLLVLPGIDIAPDDTRIFEMRAYRSPGRSLDSIFRRNGIHPILCETSVNRIDYLIPFESLASRERAWTALNTDPEWIEMRAEAGRLSEVAIYSRYPGGKIFEMSL